MRNLENSDACFHWIEPISSNVNRKRNHYKSFGFGNLKIEIGDYVLVRNDDSLDPEDWKNCFVAQVKDLFDTGIQPEPHQAKVQWFSRISELPQYSLKLLSNLDYEYEVFEERRSNFSDIIDAETIFEKCLVFFLAVDDDYQLQLSEYKRSQYPVFFCRYCFTGAKFVPKMKQVKTISRSLSFTSVASKAVKKETISFSARNIRNSVMPLKSKSVKESVYCATSTGSPDCPKVLIKKLDDRVLGYCNGNARIFVNASEIPIEGIAESLRKHLTLKTESDTLCKNVERTVSNRPTIHSLRPSEVDPHAEVLHKSKCNIADNSISQNSSPVKAAGRSKHELKRIKNAFENELTLKKSASNKVVSKHTANDKSNNLTPSPTKKFKFMKDNTDIPVATDFTLTRSGRKVKALNYCENDRVEVKKSVVSSNLTKAKKSLKFVRDDCTDSDSSLFSCEDSDSDGSAMSDCSLLDEKCTPRSNNETSKIHSSIKKKKIALNIPSRKTPLKTPQNILEESRQRLHVSSVPKSLPCREDEYSDIYSFIKGCLCARTGGCMYISGVPGTGKTATVHEVMRNLEAEQESGEIPNFSFVEINGMWMTDPYQCYVHIYKSLTGKTIASQQAAVLLEKRFTEPGPKKDAVVMLVDELDRLWTRKQTVMYNIFDWPTKKHSKLVVLAIANTMDLPERLMMSRISSRLGLTRKTFHPYTFKQLQEIIMSRIQELNVFDPDAVQLVARKVAAVSGDARRALDICKFATEVVQVSKSSFKKGHKVLVGMEHVDTALQQMFSSPLVSAIRASSNLAKLFFKSILSEFTRTGTEETSLFKVFNHIVANCRFEGLNLPSFAEISNICSHLAASHLILVDNFHNDLYMKIRLNVSSDDVNYALTGR